MSKVDFSKIQEIKNYYANEDYEAAAGLADDVNWPKVKSWDALGMMTDVYENLGEFENARDMAILAYNRNLGGKKLVYKLTDLLIKTGDYEDAEDMFTEYCSMSRNAPDSYILEYHLLRDRNAPDEELIRVLEEYKEREPDDRYMYRLAELYAKTGNKEKCIETCDNIALWFKDGDFTEGAVKLKKEIGADLSPEQEKIFGEAKVTKEDLSKTAEVDLKGQILPGLDENDGKDGEGSKITGSAAAAAAAAAGGAAVAGGAAGKLKNLVKNVFDDDDEYEDEAGAVPGAVVGAAATAEAVKENAKASDDYGIEDFLVEDEKKKTPDEEADDLLAKILKDEDSGAEAGEADKAEKSDMDPALQESLSAHVSEELETESALRGEGVAEGEEQIDGQMNMTDWMTDVREKKYGKQSTKEYSKTELERMLEEKDEKSKAYDRLMAEQKKLADEAGKPFNEALAKKKVEEQLAVNAARRDLDIRTGKATVIQENASAAVGAAVAAAAAVGAGAAADPNKEQSQAQAQVQTQAEERPQEETILGAVLEAAGTESVREAAGASVTPSDRMLRIESAVLGMLGANLSDKIAGRGKDAPADVVEAAALLVKYISGEYNSIKAGDKLEAKVKTDPSSPGLPVGSPAPQDDTKEGSPQDDTKKVSPQDDNNNNRSGGHCPPDDADKAEGTKTEAVKEAATKAEDKLEAKVEGDPSSTSSPQDDTKEGSPQDDKTPDPSKGGFAAKVAAGAAAVAGGAAVTGGVLHEKAKKAKEIFEGGVAPQDDTKKPDDADKAEAAKAEAVKAEATKAEDKNEAKVKGDPSSPGLPVGSRAPQDDTKEGSPQDDTKKPDDADKAKATKADAVKAEATKAVDKADTRPEDAPDLSKMRLKKVTAEDVEANLSDDEAAVAQKITSEDRAVDVITARITAPISTAEVNAALAASENGEIDFKDSDTFTDTTHIDKQMLREIIESSADEEESEDKNTRRFDTTRNQDTSQLDNVLREDLPKGKREKIKAMFEDYYDMPEIDAQIEEYIAALPVEITREDSRKGNIIIAGAESVDKTSLAKTLAKAVNISYPKKKKKVIKTTGENLNTYGFARSADKLRGSFLVIENVGVLGADVISEMVDVMSKDTDRMIVIAEDTDAGIESFMNTNPALPKLFNHRINMRPFTTGELVEIAKDLAKQKGFKVSEEGALALYLEVDELRAQEGKVTIEDMDALTDDAIAHARKRIKKETGVSVKKQGDEMSVLTNDDFRY